MGPVFESSPMHANFQFCYLTFFILQTIRVKASESVLCLLQWQCCRVYQHQLQSTLTDMHAALSNIKYIWRGCIITFSCVIERKKEKKRSKSESKNGASKRNEIVAYWGESLGFGWTMTVSLFLSPTRCTKYQPIWWTCDNRYNMVTRNFMTKSNKIRNWKSSFLNHRQPNPKNYSKISRWN